MISDTTHLEELRGLRERLHQLEDAFDNAAMAMHRLGPDGIILKANSAELALLGYSPEEYIGKHAADFYADPHRVVEFLRRLHNGETIVNFPARLYCKNGAIKHVLIDSNVYWQNGKFVHTRCFTRDVTDLRNAELQVQMYARSEANARSAADMERKRIFDLLSIAPHELKTPLTSLKLHLDLMIRSICPSTGKAPKLEEIKRAFQSAALLTDRVAMFVDNLLDLTRIDAGKLYITHEAVNLKSLVKDVLDCYSLQLQQAGYEIGFHGPDDIVVSCDRFQMEQVVTNLLTNAIKYGNARPISVEVLKKGHLAQIIFQDEGIGIPKEKQKVIFDRYERLCHDKNISGLGLGLYIAGEIMKAHKGSIGVESEVESGSRFIVELPLDHSCS